MKTFAVLLLSSVVWFPRAALACSTCYGAAGAPQTQSMNMAILTLMGVIGTVLGLFAAFFVFLIFRARSVALSDSATREMEPVTTGQLVEVSVHE